MSTLLKQIADAKQKIEMVTMSSLHDLPVMIRQISRPAKIADVDSVKPIHIGRVNDLLYIINDFEIAQGLLKLGAKQIPAIITDYPTIQDIIVDHVHENFHPKMIEPLLIYPILKYVSGDSMTVDDVAKLLWLDQRPDLYATIRCFIDERAREVLLEASRMAFLKKNLFATPAYYIMMLSKIDPSEQYDASKVMADVTTIKMETKAKAFWPTPEMIKSALKPYHRRQEVPPTEKRTIVYDDLKDVAKSKKKSEKKPSKTDVKKAENYILTDPSLVYAPIKADHPDIIFNKKNGRAALAGDKSGTFTIIDDIGRQTHILPPDAINYLAPEESETLFIYKYSTFEKALDALGRAKTSDRCIVISKSKIPRR